MGDIRVEIADLGDWGEATLISEYDPIGPVVRINQRALDRLCGADERARQALIDEAIAHELYHHREAIGEIPRAPSRAARERAAAEYARRVRS